MYENYEDDEFYMEDNELLDMWDDEDDDDWMSEDDELGDDDWIEDVLSDIGPNDY